MFVSILQRKLESTEYFVQVTKNTYGKKEGRITKKKKKCTKWLK